MSPLYVDPQAELAHLLSLVVAVDPYAPNDIDGPKGLPNCIGSAYANSIDEKELKKALTVIEGSLQDYISGN